MRRLPWTLGAGLGLAACGGGLASPLADDGGLHDGGATTDAARLSPDAAGALDASLSCGRSADRVDITVTFPDGRRVGCDASPLEPPSVEFKAQVLSVRGDTVTLDACAPNADCAPNTYEVRLPYDLSTPLAGAPFVLVKLEVRRSEACVAHIRVTNLPSWGGAPNPVTTRPDLLFEAADGDPAAFTDSPVQVTPELVCADPRGVGCGGRIPGDYALRFTAAGRGMIVGTGRSEMLQAGSQWYGLKTFRAYETGACEDSRQWAYVIANVTRDVGF